MRLVIINNRSYVIGLRWTTLKSRHDMKRSRADLFREAQLLNLSYDMIVTRQSQYAFGASAGNMQAFAKARSLAASLKGLLQTGDAFVGMFMLQTVEGDPVWWVIAFKDALVTALSDNVYASREEAERQRHELRELLEPIKQTVTLETAQESLDWLKPLLPEGFWASRLSGANRMESLTSLPSQHNAKLGLVGGLMLAGVSWLGASMYLDYQSAQQAMEAAQQAMRSKEARRMELLAHPERHFSMPWQTASEPKALWTACMPVMLELPLASNGWELASATCLGTSVQVVWAHKPGADYLHLPPRARLGKSSTQAVSSLPVPVFPSSSRRKLPYTELERRETISRHLYQITQHTASRLNLAFAQPQKAVVDKIEIIAPWLEGSWELKDVPDGLVLEAALTEALSLPGLVLTAIDYNTQWSMRGKVYVTEAK